MKEESSDKLLSVIIPSVESRHKYLNRLLHELDNQIVSNNLGDKVEIIVYLDDMSKNLGFKCNELYKSANGKYVVGIGDDDMVSKDYLPRILEVINNENVDQITFSMLYKNILEDKSVIMKFSNKVRNMTLRFNRFISLEFLDFEDRTKVKLNIGRFSIKGSIFVLLPILFEESIVSSECYTWPTMVIKKDISTKVKFTNRNREQDMEWALNLSQKNLIKTEHVIDDVLYFYNYDTEMSINKDKGNFNTKDLDYEIKKIKTPVIYL